MSRQLVAEHEGITLSRSWTTRQPRPGEPDDAYVFVDRATFEAAAAAGKFLEHAEFHGQLYGTPVPEPDSPAGHGVLLLEIDIQGAEQVKARAPDALLVLLLPPSREVQRQRLIGRGDPPEAVERRLASSADEEARARALGAQELVNDDLGRTVSELAAIIGACQAQRVR